MTRFTAGCQNSCRSRTGPAQARSAAMERAHEGDHVGPAKPAGVAPDPGRPRYQLRNPASVRLGRSILVVMRRKVKSPRRASTLLPAESKVGLPWSETMPCDWRGLGL